MAATLSFFENFKALDVAAHSDHPFILSRAFSKSEFKKDGEKPPPCPLWHEIQPAGFQMKTEQNAVNS